MPFGFVAWRLLPTLPLCSMRQSFGNGGAPTPERDPLADSDKVQRFEDTVIRAADAIVTAFVSASSCLLSCSTSRSSPGFPLV
ncbi:hypothetical protein [Tianweitania sediminis]|uniref:Uncharacterized protein n=1 Tax=Tianweitania sediminis TaxID=1502156 RepID=A0A8J7UJX7_9HYPH|nr:hypothetical protein [Tianweitania sediminis]MBP0439109.1 hypothetical protein [Tianweitania sediminis]